MIMCQKDVIKLVIATIFTVGQFFLIVFGSVILFGDFGLVLAIILGGLSLIIIIGFCYPIWFENYIKEYWKYQELKKEESD